MILSDDERRKFWIGLGSIQAQVNQLRGIFQNEVEIDQDDFVGWNQDLAGIYKSLQGTQVEFGMIWSGGGADKKDE